MESSMDKDSKFGHRGVFCKCRLKVVWGSLRNNRIPDAIKGQISVRRRRTQVKVNYRRRD